MTTQLIGRTVEITLLKEALQSKESEMISIIGRRRVGKTWIYFLLLKFSLLHRTLLLDNFLLSNIFNKQFSSVVLQLSIIYFSSTDS